MFSTRYFPPKWKSSFGKHFFFTHHKYFARAWLKILEINCVMNMSNFALLKFVTWNRRIFWLVFTHSLARCRLKIIEILSNFFRSVIALSPDELLSTLYLSLNQLAPAYVGLELGIGESLLMKAIAQATGERNLTISVPHFWHACVHWIPTFLAVENNQAKHFKVTFHL